MDNDTSSSACKKQAKASSRFIDYILSRSTSLKTSAQTARFDTITGQATFASDFFFTPEELKHW